VEEGGRNGDGMGGGKGERAQESTFSSQLEPIAHADGLAEVEIVLCVVT
jgi:hypothetical protein